MTFITAFETLIESTVDDCSEHLYFLDQYTSRKVKELIKGCLQMKGEDSSKEARRLLKKRLVTHTRWQVHTSPSYRAGPLLRLTTEQGFKNFLLSLSKQGTP